MKKYLTVEIFFLILIVSLVKTAPPLFSQEKEFILHRPRVNVVPTYRLDRTVIPLHYDLTIQPILDEDPTVGTRFTAPGKVSIQVEAQVAARHITFHCVTINITESSVKLLDEHNVEQEIVNQGLDDLELQTYTINLENQLNPSKKYWLSIEYVAPISQERQNGLYLTSYINDNNETRYVAATDFESVDLRRMTPAFDEPDLKATWNITIIHQKDYHSLSNMDLQISEVVSENWIKDTYNTVEKISTYIIALAVSDYTSAVADSSLLDGKPVKVWGPPPLMRQGAGEYAANLNAEVLEFFQDHFGVEYTFPKMDTICYNDFSAGAMENWGLNTYRIARLMWIEGVSTIQDKVSMTSTITHELAHQWFGDLVTMKWWDDIWLNEGFATYFATVGISQFSGIYPDYGLDDFIVVDSYQAAFKADVSPTTHPLHPTEIESPPSISVLFDILTYDKGASILRMTNHFLTPAIFKQALTNYLKNKRSSNAHQDDLFAEFDGALEAEPTKPVLPSFGANVTRILREWTTVSGFPLVTVNRDSNNGITLTQEPFLAEYSPEPGDKMWTIPITWETKNSEVNDSLVTKLWLESGESAPLPSPVGSEWTIFNPQQTGYYRVLYDPESLDLIISQLMDDTVDLDDSGKLDHKTRSALIDDSFNFLFNGYNITIEDALRVTGYMSREMNYVPWLSFTNNMATTYRLLGRTAGFVSFRKYVLGLMEPVLDEINIDPQPGEHVAKNTLLRNRLFEWACNLGSTTCTNYAVNKVQEWRDDPSNNPIFPDLKPHVYCAAVANAADQEGVSNFIFDQYKQATTDIDQTNLLRALACSKETDRLRNLLQMALNNNSGIRPAHALPAMKYVAGNSVGADITFTFIRNNFDELVLKYGTSAFASVVSTLSGVFSKTFELSDLSIFIEDNKDVLQDVQSSLDASKAAIQKNVIWISNYYTQMTSWFESFSLI